MAVWNLSLSEVDVRVETLGDRHMVNVQWIGEARNQNFNPINVVLSILSSKVILYVIVYKCLGPYVWESTFE